MIGTAMQAKFQCDRDSFVYAAGVSNSSCRDSREFERERVRLEGALELAAKCTRFVYFGTTSVTDRELSASPYVLHKLRMEELATMHPGHLILRLPQVAGRTHNPHTLLNFLRARIARSERFSVWRLARRSVIDVEDVAKVTSMLVASPLSERRIFNVVNPRLYSIAEVVEVMAEVVGKPAIFDEVERGESQEVSEPLAQSLYHAAGVAFQSDYLRQVIYKYYG